MYGSSNAPTGPGSGGGKIVTAPLATGGSGGGAIRIEASGAVTMNGTITANGSFPVDSSYGGGGSGGSIYIMCNTFGGDTNGVLRAAGGDGIAGGSGDGGGGGGGRIAVWYGVPSGERQRILSGNLRNIAITNTCKAYLGSVSVAKGMAGGSRNGATNGEPGTVVFLTLYRSGSVLQIR